MCLIEEWSKLHKCDFLTIFLIFDCYQFFTVEPKKQPRVDTDYGALSSKTRSSLLSLIQPSSSFAPSVSTDATSASIQISSSPIKPSEVSTRPVHNSSAMMMYSSTIMVSATSTLLQMLSSVMSISEKSWTSPVFHTSSIDFSSDVLSSFYSPVLSSSLVNTTIAAPVTLPGMHALGLYNYVYINYLFVRRRCKSNSCIHFESHFIHVFFLACSESDFTCHSGECVQKNFRCNRYQECRDKSDEENCPGNSTNINNFLGRDRINKLFRLSGINKTKKN